MSDATANILRSIADLLGSLNVPTRAASREPFELAGRLLISNPADIVALGYADGHAVLMLRDAPDVLRVPVTREDFARLRDAAFTAHGALLVKADEPLVTGMARVEHEPSYAPAFGQAPSLDAIMRGEH